MSLTNNTAQDGGGQGNGGPRNGLPPPEVFAKLPKIAQTDLLFTPSFLTESIIFVSFLTFFMQRLSIFKLKFSEKKNSHIINGKFDTKSDKISMKTNEISSKELDMCSMKNSSYLSSKSVTVDSNDMFDPITYLKNLNLIINKYITIYLVFIPLFALLIYSIILTIVKWNSMTTNCVNELKSVSVPKLILNSVIMISSFYFFFQAYYKQKWDLELRYEYTIFVVVVFICTVIMLLTVYDALCTTIMQYRIYIFQLVSISLQAVCIYEPLIRIVLDKFKEKENGLNEEEFLMKLSNTHFKAQVKVYVLS
ncbi:hypothetical protein PIROE2DRAFT_2908 [Piromyces sp. E2]|nr:hypothetical protein PIROE2DRAFT_2908 [Piromyces sp. E2]|eukprot:OUM69207.1 hypothetical protein PIROE2DRAFT_2908 [Piromyces sp. E2]